MREKWSSWIGLVFFWVWVPGLRLGGDLGGAERWGWGGG